MPMTEFNFRVYCVILYSLRGECSIHLNYGDSRQIQAIIWTAVFILTLQLKILRWVERHSGIWLGESCGMVSSLAESPPTQRGIFFIMPRLHNASTNEYRLTVIYQNKEYEFVARMMSFVHPNEQWFLWRGKRLLQVTYNTQTKKLSEDLLHGQKAMPEDFLFAMENVFRKRVR